MLFFLLLVLLLFLSLFLSWSFYSLFCVTMREQLVLCSYAEVRRSPLLQTIYPLLIVEDPLFVHFVCLKSVENIHFYVFLRQETDSTGSNYPIKIILWIFGVIASIKLLLKQTISSFFLSIGLRPIFQQWTTPHHLQAKTTWENLPQLCT